MDVLLRQEHNYIVTDSIETTRCRLEDILHSKWYNLSKRYSGIVHGDGTFTFSQKIVFFSVITFGRAVYLNGYLSKADEGTNIHITLAPNLWFVFLIYVLPLLWLNVLFGDNSLLGQDNGKLNNFIVVLTMELGLFAIILISSFSLKRKFEKAVIQRRFGL